MLQNRRKQKGVVEIDGDKIEITGISTENQNRLVKAFINRHE